MKSLDITYTLNIENKSLIKFVKKHGEKESKRKKLKKIVKCLSFDS